MRELLIEDILTYTYLLPIISKPKDFKLSAVLNLLGYELQGY